MPEEELSWLKAWVADQKAEEPARELVEELLDQMGGPTQQARLTADDTARSQPAAAEPASSQAVSEMLARLTAPKQPPPTTKPTVKEVADRIINGGPEIMEVESPLLAELNDHVANLLAQAPPDDLDDLDPPVTLDVSALFDPEPSESPPSAEAALRDPCARLYAASDAAAERARPARKRRRPEPSPVAPESGDRAAAGSAQDAPDHSGESLARKPADRALAELRARLAQLSGTEVPARPAPDQSLEQDPVDPVVADPASAEPSRPARKRSDTKSSQAVSSLTARATGDPAPESGDPLPAVADLRDRIAQISAADSGVAPRSRSARKRPGTESSQAVPGLAAGAAEIPASESGDPLPVVAELREPVAETSAADSEAAPRSRSSRKRPSPESSEAEAGLGAGSAEGPASSAPESRELPPVVAELRDRIAKVAAEPVAAPRSRKRPSAEPAEPPPVEAEPRDRLAKLSTAGAESSRSRRTAKKSARGQRPDSDEAESETRSRRGRRSSFGGKDDQQPAAQSDRDPASRARDICLNMLTARPRTRSELRQALLRKGIEAEVADNVLGRLDDVGLIDDKAFADMWVHSRHTYQGMGRRALSMELRRRGVDNEVVAEAVAAVDSDAEEDRARQLVRKRMPSMSSVDQQTKIRRLVGMLARKGYAQGLAYKVVKEELANLGEETNMLDTLD